MIWEIFLNSAQNGVDKGLEHIQALKKEGLEFLSDDGDVNLIFYLLLVLLSVKQDSILEQDGGKWYPIFTFGLGDGKMVLTLLKEVISLQINFNPIYV